MEGGFVRLNQGAWVHMVAIGGTGMGALAALLQDLGYQVTGSDGPLYPPMSSFLAERKIPIKNSYHADNLNPKSWGLSQQGAPELVIIGNAISRSNEEAQAVETLVAKNLTTRMSHAQALAEFGIGNRRSFVVSGTHGKTTTTALLTWALESLGRKPGFFIGGIPKNFSFGCRLGLGSVFVSEGDEYDTAYWDKESKFLHYRPSWVLCTGIEFDHADIFASIEAIEKMFIKLGTKSKEGWLLIDDESAPRPASTRAVASALSEQKIRMLRYGRQQGSDFQLLDARAEFLPWRKNVRGSLLKIKSKEIGVFEVYSPMNGEHNALNVLGVIGTLLASGEATNIEQLQKFLESFEGIKRRQDEVFHSDRLVVIDDFAHHPTAIRETIRAIRDRYPEALLAAFFEARSATSARNVFAKDFAECFDHAHSIFLSPPSKMNIPVDQKLDIQQLVTDLLARPANTDKTLVLKAEVKDLAQAFREWVSAQKTPERPVVALVMSNGPFGGIHHLLAAGVTE